VKFADSPKNKNPEQSGGDSLLNLKHQNTVKSQATKVNAALDPIAKAKTALMRT